MKRACVIGWPIEHSRSPMIHGYWLKRYGIDGAYTKEAVTPGDCESFLRALHLRGFVGCNVTVPLKEIAFRVADERDASAMAVGAANTLWLANGRLHAANTDTHGFMTHLALSAPGWRKDDRPVAILGAGGAARAIVHGFLAAGIAEVRVFNRTRARAEALAQDFGSRVSVHDWSARTTVSRDAAVIVNTTTIGMKGVGGLGVDFTGFNPACVVADIVYVPLRTAFLAAAEAHGLITVDGLGMLLHQAAPGFERWFGVKPEVTPELRAILKADIEGR